MGLRQLFILYLGLLSLAWSQDDLAIIAVGEAEGVREKIFIAPVLRATSGLTGGDIKMAEAYDKQMRGNFAFYRRIFQVEKTQASYQLTLESFETPPYDRWAKKADRYLIQSLLRRTGRILELRAKVFDLRAKREVYSERVILNPKGGKGRGFIHALCDSIYGAMTGKPSIFDSQIIFVSDRSSQGGKVVKELYMMDFDGQNRQQLTRHKGIVISPSISPDKNQVLYSLIRYNQGKRNVNLRILDLRTKKGRILSAYPGLNSGAVFAPTGDSIYLTMSYQGNAEIYKMEIGTGMRTRITRHRSDDVDPSVNARGDILAFLSNRPGKSMIHLGSTQGTEQGVRRLSFTGRFNATPRFAPSGMELAFSSWVDNRFDIYRISVDGNELTRLTKDFGSNESPSYSPDGEFIVFSSLRVISRKRAVQNLYIMDRNGDILGPVLENFGKCLSPRWSK